MDPALSHSAVDAAIHDAMTERQMDVPNGNIICSGARSGFG